MDIVIRLFLRDSDEAKPSGLWTDGVVISKLLIYLQVASAKEPCVILRHDSETLLIDAWMQLDHDPAVGFCSQYKIGQLWNMLVQYSLMMMMEVKTKVTEMHEDNSK